MPSKSAVRKREIVSSPENSKNFKFCAMLRTFNGKVHISQILDDLEGQKSKDFFTMVVDNHSDDGTWGTVIDWVRLDPSRRAASRNPFNIGGMGSIFSNLDLIQSQWVIDFHQDDRYSSDHVSTFQGAINSLPTDSKVFAASTEMGSISDSGEKLGSPPRASWFYRGQGSRLWFAASTLRTQIFPTPAAAYRVEKLKGAEPPWLSSTFGDSEISIYLRSEGELVWIPKQTMFYRENPNSESHVILGPDRLKGLELGFDRVLSSSWFVDDSIELGHPDWHELLRFIVESVHLRIGRTKVSEHILSKYLETVSLARGYDCGFSMELLQSRHSANDLSYKIIDGALMGSDCGPQGEKLEGLELSPSSTESNGGKEITRDSRAAVASTYGLVTRRIPHWILRLGWKLMPKGVRRLLLGNLWELRGAGKNRRRAQR